jgi:hypothetical protein
MQPKHIIGIVVLIAVGYLLGVKFPAFGSSVVSKVTGAA